MDESSDDRGLVSACIEGRAGAWEAFVARFSRLIFWSVRKTLAGTRFAGRPGLCEDIFQEIFARLLERGELARLREVSSLRKFLSVSACHRTLDRVKSLSREEARTVSPSAGGEAGPEPEWELASSLPDPSETAASKERESALASVLAALEPRERFCVEMHYLEGMTHREIGALLGIPQDTVSTVIRRTREKLKSRLTEAGLED
ncbi:MAG TPA: sigma-70 family RNA polymerase sigma factor [Candidatus Eisenbacteria bacterium]|nr:sigma-70 family RNA polymerase sigma factor [Candidatus Eisenbacteria bacterium]